MGRAIAGFVVENGSTQTCSLTLRLDLTKLECLIAGCVHGDALGAVNLGVLTEHPNSQPIYRAMILIIWARFFKTIDVVS